ncbi:MAG: DUF5057 domain-containing protein [Clostridiales bacterium]|nr:DUF5057 domain-containing protein [Clostridiales bacterium]
MRKRTRFIRKNMKRAASDRRGGAQLAVVISVLAVICVLVAVVAGLHLRKGSALSTSEADATVVRGVLDSIDELKAVKTNLEDDAGMVDNPFFVLEIVPYEEYAEIGYQIAGCEPITLYPTINSELQGAVNTLNIATITPYAALYYFGDEEEASNPLRYSYKQPYWVYTDSYYGYYELVEDGTGNFIQQDGEIVAQEGGNLIWHTVNGSYVQVEEGTGYFTKIGDEFDENWNWIDASYVPSAGGDYIWQSTLKSDDVGEDQAFSDSPDKAVSYIGDRIYTTRQCSEDDPVYQCDFYSYVNNDNFVIDTLGLTADEAATFSIVIKTITPEELNETPEWVDYANLISISPKSHNAGMVSAWETYNRLGHEATANRTDNFFGNDISWEVAMKIYDKATADENYAGLMLDVACYDVSGTISDEYEKTVTFDILDWNLDPAYYMQGDDVVYYTYSTTGYKNNVYKLALMLMSMDTSVFKSLYLDEDGPKGVNISKDASEDTGYYNMQEGDAAIYWTAQTFLPLASTESYENPFTVWNSEEMWDSYGINGNLTNNSKNVSWIKDHVYVYNGDNSITSGYLSDGGAVNGEMSEYADYLDSIDKSGNGSPSDAVRFILGTHKSTYLTGTLRILDIEPCYESVGAWEDDDSVPEGWRLTVDDIKSIIPNCNKSTLNIEITHMTTAAFNGTADDLNSEYDLIYIGLQDGAYNLNTSGTQITLAEGGNSTEYLPNWNDSSLDGFIYFHTGDLVYANDPSANSNSQGGGGEKGQNVNFLYTDSSGNIINGLDYGTASPNENELRYSGNDITELMKEKLDNFVAAGYPVIAENELYNLNKSIVDENSYIYKFVSSAKSSANSVLYSTDDGDAIFETLYNNMAPSVDFTSLPAIYNGTVSSGYKVSSPNYLTRTDDGVQLPFAFTVTDSDETHSYAYKIFYDQNQDTKFSDDEIIYEGSAFSTGGSSATASHTCVLDVSTIGVIQWKIEVYRTDNENICWSENGISVASLQDGADKENISVLQLIPNDDTSRSDYLNLETNSSFKKYFDELNEYTISVDAMLLDDYNKLFSTTTEEDEDGNEVTVDSGYVFSYDTNEDGTVKDSNIDENNSVDMLYKKYDMIIIGFGDAYGGVDLTNDDGEVDFIKYWIAKGKGILFTHDLTSLNNNTTGNTSFGFTANTQLRDVMDMNRYGAVSMYSSAIASIMNYQGLNSQAYSTVTDISGNLLGEIQGFSYYGIKRLAANSSANTNAGYTMPYRYLVTNPWGVSVSSKSAATGFDEDDDLTTKATMLNAGQITSYPFAIDEEINVASTHGQYYELNMEDPELTVWYCLGNDGLAQARSSGDKTGTAMTYGVSPNDASNNYYIYSKSNVFYSGVGHTTVTEDGEGDMEIRLLINTIIAAYRATYQPPVVIIDNDEDNSTADEVQTTAAISSHKTSYEYFYDLDATDATAFEKTESGTFQSTTMADYNDQYAKVYFTPTELNGATTTLTLAIYCAEYDGPDPEDYEGDDDPVFDFDNWVLYNYTDSNASISGGYFQTIYDADTGSAIKAQMTTAEEGGTEYTFTGIKQGHQYYMYVPKSMLIKCEDIIFRINSNKADGYGHTCLTIEADDTDVPLFILN